MVDLGTENLKVGDESEVEDEEEDEDEDGDNGLRSLMQGNDDDEATDIFLGFCFCKSLLFFFFF